MFAFIKMIGSYFNTQIFMSKMMSEMQYAKLNAKDKLDKELMKQVVPLKNGFFNMQYHFKDMFSDVYDLFYIVCCCKCGKQKSAYMSKSQLMFQRGYAFIEKDLSTFEIMKTIKKLKSVISFILKRD